VDQKRDPAEPDMAAILAADEFIGLVQAFPAWAVWCPDQDRPWIAVRAASSGYPRPGSPLIWAQAPDVIELEDRMRRADEQMDG
jgi:hypothetical protein